MPNSAEIKEVNVGMIQSLISLIQAWFREDGWILLKGMEGNDLLERKRRRAFQRQIVTKASNKIHVYIYLCCMYMCSLQFTNPFMSTTLFKHYSSSLRRYNYYFLSGCLKH